MALGLPRMTNLKVTHYPLNSFLPRCYFSKMNTYLHEPNIYLDTFNALLWLNNLIIFNKSVRFIYFKNILM